MKKSIKLSAILILISLFTLSSCQSNVATVENTFNGNMQIKGSNPEGEFTGNNSSGVYSFNWNNTRDFANADLDMTVSKGSVQLIVNDVKGVEVFNTTLVSGGLDSFSGVTNKGQTGEWLIKLVFKDFNGEGSFSVERGRN